MRTEHDGMTPEHLIIEVCSCDEASAILCSPSQRADIAFLISIGDEWGVSQHCPFDHHLGLLPLVTNC